MYWGIVLTNSDTLRRRLTFYFSLLFLSPQGLSQSFNEAKQLCFPLTICHTLKNEAKNNNWVFNGASVMNLFISCTIFTSSFMLAQKFVVLCESTYLTAAYLNIFTYASNSLAILALQ